MRRPIGIEGFIDRIFLGDIMELLKQLPDNSVDMVYGDPDYNVGIKYGENTYTKSFTEYIEWSIGLTRESLRVLKNDGNLFMMNYPKQNAHLRVRFLDDVCTDVFEYVWVYNTNIGHSPKRFTTAHRTILHCRKSEHNKFYKDQVAVPYQNPTDKRIRQNIANGSKGRMPYDWFYFDLVKNVSHEKTIHACQIPQSLTEMLVKACTTENDVVLVLFGGSGSEIEVCQKLNRHFLSAEIDPKYHRIIEDRLEKGKISSEYRMLYNMRKEPTADSNQPRLLDKPVKYSTESDNE
ncbi:MAG: site-specific DNA-methyltransferase [Anaerolineales bacterium]|nr:site-specific DNA-methyltransferase [Anaerolineales bacterium]